MGLVLLQVLTRPLLPAGSLQYAHRRTSVPAQYQFAWPRRHAFGRADDRAARGTVHLTADRRGPRAASARPADAQLYGAVQAGISLTQYPFADLQCRGVDVLQGAKAQRLVCPCGKGVEVAGSANRPAALRALDSLAGVSLNQVCTANW